MPLTRRVAQAPEFCCAPRAGPRFPGPHGCVDVGMSLTFVVLNPSDSEQRMNSSIADAKLERGTSLANGSKCRCHHNETSPRLRSRSRDSRLCLRPCLFRRSASASIRFRCSRSVFNGVARCQAKECKTRHHVSQRRESQMKRLSFVGQKF
jgi:hypothetical protein